MKFGKKPVVIEAIQFIRSNSHEIEVWSSGKVFSSPVLEPTKSNPTGEYLQVKTLEGMMTAVIGDWIIKGVKGEFYPCKPDIFELTYEPAEQKADEGRPAICRDCPTFENECEGSNQEACGRRDESGLLTIDEEYELKQEWMKLPKDSRLSWRDFWLKAQRDLTASIKEARYKQALFDSREGKDLDLSEEEFEVFSAIQNLGTERAYAECQERIGEERQRILDMGWKAFLKELEAELDERCFGTKGG